MVILLMGAAGVGKSTVGRRLAEALNWPFHDADDLHSPAAIAKMRAGLPLDDEDRAPWLERVRGVIAGAAADRQDAVVACSALKARYRRVLTARVPDVRLVHLVAAADVLRRRVAARAEHFMPASLVDAQLRDLEPPDRALVVDAGEPVDVAVGRIRAELGV